MMASMKPLLARVWAAITPALVIPNWRIGAAAVGIGPRVGDQDFERQPLVRQTQLPTWQHSESRP